MNEAEQVKHTGNRNIEMSITPSKCPGGAALDSEDDPLLGLVLDLFPEMPEISAAPAISALSERGFKFKLTGLSKMSLMNGGAIPPGPSSGGDSLKSSLQRDH